MNKRKFHFSVTTRKSRQSHLSLNKVKRCVCPSFSRETNYRKMLTCLTFNDYANKSPPQKKISFYCCMSVILAIWEVFHMIQGIEWAFLFSIWALSNEPEFTSTLRMFILCSFKLHLLMLSFWSIRMLHIWFVQAAKDAYPLFAFNVLTMS